MSDRDVTRSGVDLDRETRRPSLPSLLPGSLKAWLAVMMGLAAFMVANALYLLANRGADAAGWEFFAVGETSLPKLFQGMVLAHTGVGLLLAALMLGFLFVHLRKVWRRRHRASIVSGIAYAVVGVGLTVTGLFILTAAASRDNRWAWWAHVIFAALIPAGYMAHRVVSYTRPPSARFRRFGVAVATLLVIGVVAHGLTNRDVEWTPEAAAALEKGLSEGPGGRERDVARFTDADYVPPGFVPPESPFFPSAATTTSGDYLPSRIITRGEVGSSPEAVAREARDKGFAVESAIGAESCVRCHADVVEQWRASAHRFASFNNPFYEATIMDLRRNSPTTNRWIERHWERYPETNGEAGRVKSKWCSGCHDPALMLAGKMNVEIDRASVEAQAGLTCLACHAIDRVHDQTGNGNYNIADAQEDPYIFADARSGTWQAFLHDAALKAKPTVHKRQMLTPAFKGAEFCATCHKVSLREPLNNYRWLRGQDEYDAWHDSGVSLNASRTFYLPPVKRVCQDCHMPLEPAPLGDVAADDGLVKSHRFLAVNTALPYVRGDRETIVRIERFLRDEKLSVDIFALRSDRREVPLTALDRAEVALDPGETVSVDVVVRNRGVGHTFPGGTNDSNEGWLQFEVADEEGRVLALSGGLDEDGHLDEMAHVYKAVILDRHGEPIHMRNAQDIHVAAAVNVIGPGTADLAHYRFEVPAELAGRTLTLRARLLWRKFDRAYTEFAYRSNPAGFRLFDDVPDLPVTEIAADEVRLAVGDGPRPASTAGSDRAEGPQDWTRHNDYGIGLLLEGDTRGALRAFARVEELAPERIDGPLNMARVALRDGNLEAAYEHLRRAEEVEPGNARAAWVWGLTLMEDGRYEGAEEAFRRVLEDFPEDRAAWRNLGRTLYLDQRYEQALAAFEAVLAIDPEDRVAHYHRMLICRALGRQEDAAVAEAAYERFRIDESAQAIAGDFRRNNPGVNLMAQPLHSHDLELRTGRP